MLFNCFTITIEKVLDSNRVTNGSLVFTKGGVQRNENSLQPGGRFYWCKSGSIFSQNLSEDEIYNLDALTYAGNLESLIPVEDAPNYHFVHMDITDREAYF